jgi:hypothetical protein
MSTVLPSVTIDTSKLRACIPGLVATGRRTMAQQCVTSLGWIFVNTQKATPAVSLGRIDAELDAPGKTIAGKTSRLTAGQMIVLARTSPTSAYSVATGNRWPLKRPTLRGADFERAYGDAGMAKQVFTEWLESAAERQKRGRHSSTHFLRHGFAAGIQKAFANENFRHSKKYRTAASAMSDSINHLNRLDHVGLGEFFVSEHGDSVFARAENNVGERGPAEKLNEKHRRALISIAAPLAQAEVDKEAAVCEGELAKRMDAELVPAQRQLA